MKNILTRGGIEFLAVFIEIVSFTWSEYRRDLNTTRENDYKTLQLLGKNHLRKFILRLIKTYL